MPPLQVLTIIGTRPEAVKMGPVVQALARHPEVASQVCVTAQHRQMLDQVLALFQITPDYDLDLMRPGQSLAEVTAAIFTHLDPVFASTRPDWILVQGDTTTVMAAGLLGYYHRIRVGHVEAGLRTGDKWQPFPEEINRRVVGTLADLHFAPTDWAAENLRKEGVPAARIRVTGNPVIDALQQVAGRPATPDVVELFNSLGIPPERSADAPHIILVTAHRRENFGEPLENICEAILELAGIYKDRIHFVYPVHLNPNVQEPVRRLLGGAPQVTLLEPLDYLPLVQLLKRSTLVLTDSGGLQEEAPGLGVPVLVMRAVTERPEGVEAGTVKLVGADRERLVAETRRLLDDPQAYAAMAQAVNPYGDGRAAGRIVEGLLTYEI
ncbi:MAG: UDP-N-acetylglucosamine 2-epimerase (non-hydrolyzing) [Anaerolineales bacterium]|nr:UDP-N-acetylglucosamine 2-epimerase (non-hydrolyzing) [Anaerolineales bacterium]